MSFDDEVEFSATEVQSWVSSQKGRGLVVTIPPESNQFGDASTALEQFARSRPGVATKLVRDPGGSVTSALGGTTAPTIFVVDQGKVVQRAEGLPAPLRLTWAWNRAFPESSPVPEPDAQGIVHADDMTFESAATATEKIVLVDLWATWCGPCVEMGPALEAFAQAEADRVQVVKVDVDEAPQTASRFEVDGIPALIVLHEGEILDRRLGRQSQADLTQWLDAVSSTLPGRNTTE